MVSNSVRCPDRGGDNHRGSGVGFEETDTDRIAGGCGEHNFLGRRLGRTTESNHFQRDVDFR